MTDTTAARLAKAGWAIAAAVTAANGVLIFYAIRAGSVPGIDLLFDGVGAITGGLFASIGLLIVLRARNAVGGILIGTGICLALETFSSTYIAVGLVAYPDSLPNPKLVSTVLQPMWILTVSSLGFLLLLFPVGRPPSPRWRPVLWVGVTGVVAGYVGELANPVLINPETGISFANPIGIERLGGFISTALVGVAWVTVLAVAACLVGLVVRFRSGDQELRQQIKWLGLAAGGAIASIVIGLGSLVACQCNSDVIGGVMFIAFFLFLAVGMPAAISVAIFKYRLYDIGVVMNKAVLYALLAAFFTAIYVAVVIGVGAAAGSRNSFLTIAAAVVIAVAFQPVRERARHLANRIVYGKRASPYEVMAQFSERMAGAYSSDDVLPRMAEILARGTGALTARVWLRLGEELRPAASFPRDVTTEPAAVVDDRPAEFSPGEHVEEVRHQGELLGALSVVMPPSEPMNPSKAKLVRDLAAQAGLVLRNVHLLEDVRASRRRIVTAQDERAKALERNIHDGAQQQLVALSVKQRLAETLIDRDPEKARAMLREIQGDTVDALETLRDLARGIYPPLLADQGLGVALQAQLRKVATAATVLADGVGRYTPEVEAAVYFCCLEALQNVAKYAQAAATEVRLTREDDRLLFLVTDDGIGFDPSRTPAGTGLQGMADRLEALGGGLEIRSRPGHGTTLTGWIPARSLEPSFS